MKYETLNKAIEACDVAVIKSNEMAVSWKNAGKNELAEMFERKSKEFEDCRKALQDEFINGKLDT